jgi:hypothetical protein
VLPYKLADWLSECRPGLFREELIKKFEVPGVLIKHVTFGQGKRGVWPYEDADNDPDADRPSALEERYPRICFDILRGLNIINEITTNEIWCGDRVVIISYDELTPLGVEFFHCAIVARVCSLNRAIAGQPKGAGNGLSDNLN